MKVQVVVGIMAAVLTMSGIMAAAKKQQQRCSVCDPEACPKLNLANCMAGTTKDPCGCCDVCAKLEGETCEVIDNRDPCGDGLTCQDSESTGRVCQCQFPEFVCGSDGKTYTNLCQLLATAVRERRTNTLHFQRAGPCEAGARILTKPEYVRNHTNSKVVLQCEAMGMPPPAMAWTFTRADNKTFNVPADDWKVVTSTRGGPGKYMVSTWLQIEGLQKSHEGDYTCVAINQQKDQAKARIKVVERN